MQPGRVRPDRVGHEHRRGRRRLLRRSRRSGLRPAAGTGLGPAPARGRRRTLRRPPERDHHDRRRGHGRRLDRTRVRRCRCRPHARQRQPARQLTRTSPGQERPPRRPGGRHGPVHNRTLRTERRMSEVPGLDTVSAALDHPDTPQPYAELGMADDEYARVREILGRRTTAAELTIYSVMWSEHCSYKSSKVHLRQFGEKAPESDALLVGMGQNAGVVDVGDGRAVTFKIESHNSPSYVEPHQGAATGVGGIVRDILTMGARPDAVMDALRFGPADAGDTKRVLPGVVSGISFYGNCLGLPNIGGELGFDTGYLGNPLVNALCVGVMRHEDIKLAEAPGPGNKVVLFGATTGPDGIGGASVLASANFDDESHTKRPSVQVGDPFMEKLLIECSLELYGKDLVVGIQDLGAAGVSCATTELAAGGTG